MKLCPVCFNFPAIIDPVIGVLPCKHCTKRRSINRLPNKPVEFTSDEIKIGRLEYFKSAIQPMRAGEPSKEFIEEYPEESKGIFTAKQRRKAKNVWSDLKGHKDRHNSK